ncbi:MAG TPA: tRNA (adenosine(37)-N6)-threonylcarbamoyltransferase complex dimerization subunit type 1 TsaB [Phycisphaerae bacterium]|nr:tRNA (adenosine(37)-N6)-threonylcarbamoyltransferase complex dimerization subunit type 1 TsaB [Phycisphaerae bacterium]
MSSLFDNDGPKGLAIETSSRHGSVAVSYGPHLLQTIELPVGNRHATELMPAISALTAKVGWRPDQIEHVYLSLGPGSFTGLRIAIAIARAMHQAVGCKLLGVPTLNVIAENAPGAFAYIVPILDAKRGQVFAARYRRTGAGGELVRVAEPALVEPAEYVRETLRIANGATMGVLGEGVEYHRTALACIPAESVQMLDPSHWPPRAATVHRLGYRLAQQGAFANPATLLPIYIRLPEAEEVWRKKHGVPL